MLSMFKRWLLDMPSCALSDVYISNKFLFILINKSTKLDYDY